MKLNCIRINPETGETKEESHRAILRHSGGIGWSVYLEPGLTGYESFVLSDWWYKRNRVEAWSACAGGNGWDKLVVPAEEMERLKDILELLPI